MSESLQVRNAALVNWLSGDFQLRYEPNFAWKSACAAFLALPGLRGFWPMSSFNESGNAYDLCGQGRILTYNGNPLYNSDNLEPYIDLDGTGDYLSRTDEAGLDIIGTETYVAVPGLTIGGWFWVDTFAGDDGMIGKYNAGTNNRSYLLFANGANTRFNFIVSTDGIANVVVNSAALLTGTWYFAVGRFIPSTEISVFVNNVEVPNAVGIPATIFNSNADLNVGAFNNGGAGTYLDGRASMCFLCTVALSDAIIRALFYQTQAMFGV